MAITLVQHKSNSSASGTTLAVTIAANSANNLIVVVAGGGSATITVTGVSDNATGGSNTYVQAASARATATGHMIDCWYVLSAAHAGATTVTVTFSSSISGDAFVMEVSGFTTAALDVVGTVNNGVQSGGQATGASVTTTSTTGFIIAGDITNAGVTANPHAGNEFTSGGDVDGNSNAACSKISSTAAAHQPVWDDTGTVFVSNTVAFKESSGSSGVFEDDSFKVSIPGLIEPNVSAWR